MTVKERDNRIDVICQHTRDGKIIPLKIRVKDEDGEFQSFTVQGYRDLTHPGRYTLGNGVEVSGCNIKTYECKIVVFGVEKIVRIFYNASENLWREVRKEEQGII